MSRKVTMGSPNNQICLRYLSILAFFVALNFFERASILLMIGLSLFFVFFLYRFRLKTYIDSKTILILTFSVFAFLSSITFYTARQAIQALYFFVAYFVGKMAGKYAVDSKQLCKTFSMSVIYGYGLNIVFNYIYNAVTNPRMGVRVVFSIWSGKQQAVTYWAPISLVLAAAVLYVYVARNSNQGLLKKGLLAFMLLCTIAFGLASATRTMVLSVCFVPLITGIIFMRKKINIKFRIKTIQKTVVILSVLIILFFVFFDNIIDYIIDYIINSPFVNRFTNSDILDTGRNNITTFFLSNLYKYPFGGEFVSKEYGQYAHNLFLEIYDSYGLIPFVMMILLYVLCVKDMFILKRNINDSVVCLYAGLLVSFSVICLIEPLLHSNISCIWIFLMIFGVFSEYTIKIRKGTV